jgi:hypothetical protein
MLSAPIRPRDGLKHVAIEMFEVNAATAVIMLDLVKAKFPATLPSSWNFRPATDDRRVIAREFLSAIAILPAGTPRPIGLRVPSVLSSMDFHVLLDPSRKSEMSASISSRIPFSTLRVAGSGFA